MTHSSRPNAGDGPTSREEGAPRAASKASRTFGPERRVRKRAEFQDIQGQGRRVPTRHFVLLLRARAARSGARLGVTASKRVGNSVVRSRIKRIVREAFRHADGLFDDDVDVVVLVRGNVSELAPSQVLAEWRDARSRVKRAAESARRDLVSGVSAPAAPRSRGRGGGATR